ncbi:hypothetical protein [Sphingobium fluviale]|uniref:Energy transducer TonB n=1 Tax=Sphingobium fluviale TaxID=2506423 RepID=A0A4Q1KJU2_9SPHN|nr:hypothetical protein [Sphingobium fluviale]RXR29902.1 hypothetical protein EQG66_05025 [Sphingobium fluviale]
MSTIADQSEFQEPHGNRIVQIGLIVVGAALALWLVWYLYTALTGVHGVTVKNETPVISPLLPPPPPPPPPPPKPEEKPPEPTDKPTPTPEPKPQAAPTPTIDGPPQTSGPGLQSGPSSNSPISGDSTCIGPNCKGTNNNTSVADPYYNRTLSTGLQRCVQNDRRLSREFFTADYAITANPAGKVTGVRLVRSSGSSDRDGRIASVLSQCVAAAPPAGFKFPQRISVKGRR